MYSSSLRGRTDGTKRSERDAGPWRRTTVCSTGSCVPDSGYDVDLYPRHLRSGFPTITSFAREWSISPIRFST